jgi:hypothetical protein
VKLRRAYFLNADVKLMEFVGVEWCSIGGRRGIWEETLVSEEEGKPSLTDVEKLYRQLKQNHEERRDFASAGDFHMGEKEMRLRNRATPLHMRVMLALYKWTCGYGESILRPLIWFVGLASYIAALSLLGGLTDKSTKEVLEFSNVKDWGSAVLFAIDKSFHLPGDYFLPNNSVRGLQTMIGILGPLFVALFGLSVRNRLRR